MNEEQRDNGIVNALEVRIRNLENLVQRVESLERAAPEQIGLKLLFESVDKRIGEIFFEFRQELKKEFRYLQERR